MPRKPALPPMSAAQKAAHRELVEFCEDKIAGALPEVIDAMIELARGVTVERNGKTFLQPPLFEAQKWLAEKVMGKPAQRIETDHHHVVEGYEDMVKRLAAERAQELKYEVLPLPNPEPTAEAPQGNAGGEGAEPPFMVQGVDDLEGDPRQEALRVLGLD